MFSRRCQRIAVFTSRILPSVAMGTPSISNVSAVLGTSFPVASLSTDSAPSTQSDTRPLSPFLIGVAGGTASGKTTVCDEIIRRLGDRCKPMVGVIGEDAFYRELNDEENAAAQRGDFNFDHPSALDYQVMLETVEGIKRGKVMSVPTYDFRTNARVPGSDRRVGSLDVLIFEGILAFYFEPLRQLFDLKLFVDADPDLRLARRVIRDMRERGRTLEHIFHQYFGLVKPAYEEFCLPTKKYADIIIPRGVENNVAIELIVKHIQELLRSHKQRL